jgi:hypothetical protein
MKKAAHGLAVGCGEDPCFPSGRVRAVSRSGETPDAKPGPSGMPEPDVTQDALPEQAETPSLPPEPDATLDEQLVPHAIPALRQVTNAIQPDEPHYAPLEQDAMPDELPNAPLEPHAMPVAPQDEPRPHCAQQAALLRHDCRPQPRYAERSSAVPQPWLQAGHGWH